MPSLRELEVSFNPTEFPRAIDRYPSLEKLFVVECGLRSLPEEVASLSRLSWLNLNVNQLTHLPEGLTRMPELKLLYVKANLLRSLPDFRASSLTEVMVGGNPLTSAQIAGAFPPAARKNSGLRINILIRGSIEIIMPYLALTRPPTKTCKFPHPPRRGQLP